MVTVKIAYLPSTGLASETIAMAAVPRPGDKIDLRPDLGFEGAVVEEVRWTPSASTGVTLTVRTHRD